MKAWRGRQSCWRRLAHRSDVVTDEPGSARGVWMVAGQLKGGRRDAVRTGRRDGCRYVRSMIDTYVQ
jgi:hypothetical protein